MKIAIVTDSSSGLLNEEVNKDKKTASAADFIFLFGLSLAVSALCQWLGGICNDGLKAIGLGTSECRALMFSF